MKLDNLIDVLANNDPRPTKLAPTESILRAAILSLALVLAISIVWLKLRPDLPAELPIYNQLFFVKLAFTAAIVATAIPIVRNLCVPGRKIGWPPILLAAAPFAFMAAFGLRDIFDASGNEWTHHVGASSWLDCLWQIPALAAPAFLILTVAIRRLAPTDLVETGVCVGLLAGGIGAIGYTLHCHDDFVVFVALSYSAAILEVTLLGALLGPRLFRWT